MAIELTASNIVGELDRRIRARVPITAIQTHEEQRFLRALRVVGRQSRHQDKPIFVWSRTMGLRKLDPDGSVVQTYKDTEDPMGCIMHINAMGTDPANPDDVGRGLFVLCDFASYLSKGPGYDDDMLVRAVRELAWDIKSRYINVFMVGPDFPNISGLEKEVHPMEMMLPSEGEVAAILDGRIQQLKEENYRCEVDDKAVHEELVGAMAGLTEDEADTALAIATITNGGLGPDAVPIILEQKKEAIRRLGSLTFMPPEPLEYFGGYDSLIEMVRASAETFKPEAKEFGIEPHKGFLLIGPPGCGKDFLKKIISGLVNRALLDLDFGSVMGEGGGIIGQAEMTAKRALQIATALEPVLGISEFEKMFGGLASSSRGDAGTTARTIGLVLNWMAEQKTCMVVATANDVRQLAPEQIREGRFGAKVWVGLPSAEDRASIFRVHLAKRNRDPSDFNLELLAEHSERFSGAEIEQAVKNALLHAWVEGQGNRDVTMMDLERGITNITPTGLVNKTVIDELEKWAEENLGAVSASGKGMDMLFKQRAAILSDKRPLEV